MSRRVIGNIVNGLNSSAPSAAIIVFDVATNTPHYALVQEGLLDLAIVTLNGVTIPVINLLGKLTYTDTFPQANEGCRKNIISFDVYSADPKGYPFAVAPLNNLFYQGGQIIKSVYFGVYLFDRSQQISGDLNQGCCLGYYVLDSSLAWDEVSGVTKFQVADVLNMAMENVGYLTTDVDPTILFAYNNYHTSDNFPVVYGAVPRIRMMNAFPSFSVSLLTMNISGHVLTAYNLSSTTIELEADVNIGDALLQLANLGGTARIKMADGEIIAGTLVYDSTANTITLDITARNTYYAQVMGYMNSGDGLTPAAWADGPASGGIDVPNYGTVNFSATSTIIPNGSKIIISTTGFMQADIQEWAGSPGPGYTLIANAVAQMTSVTAGVVTGTKVADNTRDSVSHSLWTTDTTNQYTIESSISAYFASPSNDYDFPSGTTIVYSYGGFEWMKFYATPQPIRLFINNPAILVPGQASATLCINVGTATGVGTPSTPVTNGPMITSGVTEPATLGVGFTYTITANNSPTSYTATSLPSWATFNPVTGTIGGIPTTNNTSYFIPITATDNAGIGAIGASWQLVGFDAASVDNSCYMRNGLSQFSIDNVYYEADSQLLNIPVANIVSVTQRTTAYTLQNLAQITLTSAPLDMTNILPNAKSNIVYADAGYDTTGDGQNNRAERIITAVVQTDTILPTLCGNSVSLSGTSGTDYPADNFLPWIGILVRKPSTVSAVLNRALYQCNAALDWIVNKFQLRLRNTPYGIGTLWSQVTWTPPGGSAGQYINLPVFATSDQEQLENGATMTCGQVVSKMRAGTSETEIPACHTKLNYGGWEDPNYPIAQAQKKNLLVSNDRLVEYTFDFINDADSYALAAAFFKTIGHPSAVTQVDRRLSMKMNLMGLRWQSGDIIVWNNFPMVTTTDETDGFFDGTGTYAGILYNVEHDGSSPPNYYTDRLMGALGVVLSVKLTMDTDMVDVTVESRQSNLWLNDLDILASGPPYVGNPNQPQSPGEGTPNGGGAGTSGGYGGGGGNPMPFYLSHPAGMTINTTLTDPTCDITVTPLGDIVNNIGWVYQMELLSKTVPAAVPGHDVGCSPVVGAVSNWPGDVPTTHTLVAGYNSFRNFGFGNQVKETQIQFQMIRTIPAFPGSTVATQDFTKWYLNIQRPDPTGITAS